MSYKDKIWLTTEYDDGELVQKVVLFYLNYDKTKYCCYLNFGAAYFNITLVIVNSVHLFV